MNDTASYFGDPVMTQDQIAILVDEIYEKFGESRASSLSLTKQPADRRLHLPCAFSANCVPTPPLPCLTLAWTHHPTNEQTMRRARQV